MNQEKDLCPLTDSGYHRYFIFKVVEVFEPIKTDGKPAQLVEAIRHEYSQLYEKVEYALQGCNCGSSIKMRVKQQ